MPNMNLTELEAVNRILRAARERPISALGSTTLNDALTAESVLNEVLQREQMLGQHVNTQEVEFTPDPGDGNVVLPSNTLTVHGSNQQANRNYYHKLVSGEVLLFDADKFPATADFGATGADTSPVFVQITQALDFEELPAPIQFSIVDQAAVEYQEAVLGDDALGSKLEARAGRSRAVARSYDMHSQPHNLFSQHARSTGPKIGQAVPRAWRETTVRRQGD